jgi:hypothetical protein
MLTKLGNAVVGESPGLFGFYLLFVYRVWTLDAKLQKRPSGQASVCGCIDNGPYLRTSISSGRVVRVERVMIVQTNENEHIALTIERCCQQESWLTKMDWCESRTSNEETRRLNTFLCCCTLHLSASWRVNTCAVSESKNAVNSE